MKKISLPVRLIIILFVFLSLSCIVFLARTDVLPPELEKVALGTSHTIAASLVVIAQDQGIFANQGIELILKEYASSKLALDDVCENQLDLTLVAETPVVFKSFERDDMRILASLFSAFDDPKVIARKTSRIKSPKDLGGKHIGTTKKGQSAHYFLHLFLIRHGLSEQDVLLSFASPDELKQGLADGKFDALSLFEPHITEIAHALSEETIVFSEPELYLKRNLLVTHEDFARKRPQTVRNILRALKRAKDFALGQPEKALRIVAKELCLSVPDVRNLWEQAILEVSLEQSLLLTLENEAKWILEKEFTDKKKIPNYLNIIHFDGLDAVDPISVSIYH